MKANIDWAARLYLLLREPSLGFLPVSIYKNQECM